MSHNDEVCDLMAEHGQMKAALEAIAAIEDEEYGSDWAEIEKAREIANKALAKVQS
jgi:hypothetical protein